MRPAEDRHPSLALPAKDRRELPSVAHQDNRQPVSLPLDPPSDFGVGEIQRPPRTHRNVVPPLLLDLAADGEAPMSEASLLTWMSLGFLGIFFLLVFTGNPIFQQLSIFFGLAFGLTLVRLFGEVLMVAPLADPPVSVYLVDSQVQERMYLTGAIPSAPE